MPELTATEFLAVLRAVLEARSEPTAAPPSAPLCVDCRCAAHYENKSFCTHTTVKRFFDPVTGTNLPLCLTAREPGSPCGQGGTLWEARPV